MQNTTYPDTIREETSRKITKGKKLQAHSNLKRLNKIQILARNKGEGGRAESRHKERASVSVRLGVWALRRR